MPPVPASSSVGADEDALLAAITAAPPRLIATSHVLWTTGRRFDLPPALKRGERPARSSSTAAQSAGARFRSTSAEASTSTNGLRSEVAVRNPTPAGRACTLRRSCGRPGSRLRSVFLAGLLRDSRARSSRRRARRGSTAAGSGPAGAQRHRGGARRAIRRGATSARRRWLRAVARAARTARRGRDAGGEFGTLVSLPAARPIRRSSSRICRTRGVIVRELPGRNLVRALVRLVDERKTICKAAASQASP